MNVNTRVLVQALVRANGTVDAGELYDVAGRFGMSDQQVRLCVKRLVAEGRFTSEGRGRKGTLHAVADITGSLAPDAAHVRRAYRQDAGLEPWDGTWHLFSFAIPESRRAARDTLREHLLHLGAASVHSGLYVTASPVAELVEAQARQLDVMCALTRLTTTDLQVGGMTKPRALAAALWPLGEIAERHVHLAAFAEKCLAQLAGELSEVDRLTMAVELAEQFTVAMERDPLLPLELLPQPWPGTAARRLAADCWNRLAEIESPESLRLFALYAAAP